MSIYILLVRYLCEVLDLFYLICHVIYFVTIYVTCEMWNVSYIVIAKSQKKPVVFKSVVYVADS